MILHRSLVLAVALLLSAPSAEVKLAVAPDVESGVYEPGQEASWTQAARYFDAMNFAPRVKCPALVGVGLIDTVCPSEGVIAAFNQFKGPKKLVILPRAGHGGDGDAHKAYNTAFGAFLDEAKRGGGGR